MWTLAGKIAARRASSHQRPRRRGAGRTRAAPASSATPLTATIWIVDRQGMLAGLKHPLRRRILKLMLVRRRAMSPSEIATALGLPLSNVSYHVRVLAELGMLRLEGTEPVGGPPKHLYRPTAEVEGDAWVRETLELPRVEDEDGAGTA